jgi:hypothetical protein
MLELTSYGLTGLVAMLAVVFCLACSDDRASAKDKSSFDSVNNAQYSDRMQQSPEREGHLRS